MLSHRPESFDGSRADLADLDETGFSLVVLPGPFGLLVPGGSKYTFFADVGQEPVWAKSIKRDGLEFRHSLQYSVPFLQALTCEKVFWSTLFWSRAPCGVFCRTLLESSLAGEKWPISS